MTDHHIRPSVAALRKLEAALHLQHDADRAQPEPGEFGRAPSRVRTMMRVLCNAGAQLQMASRQVWRRRGVRGAVYGLSGLAMVVLVAGLGLWWRLGHGPIEIDLATPWLAAAIEENFGKQQKVEIGGTQIERDADGHTAIRIRDIVVRDKDGTVVASAPKAEVSVSGTSLLSGRLRAEKLSLVGAELSVRIETNGEVTVFAGADKKPIAVAPLPLPKGARQAPALAPDAPGAPAALPAPVATSRSGLGQLAALMTWIDGLSQSGLDGHELGQLGLKNGNLTVDDQRSGQRWSFQNINIALARPASGGVAFTVASENPERPWAFIAAMRPPVGGRRAFTLEARKVSASDVLLAFRFGDGKLRADVPVSASVRGEIGNDGLPMALAGRILVEAGQIGDPAKPDTVLDMERAEINFEWDSARQQLLAPFQIVSGGNRITLLARAEAPRDDTGAWSINLTGGTIVLAPMAGEEDTPLILNRIGVKAQYDQQRRRLELTQAEIGNLEFGVAVSGSVDFSTSDPILKLGVAGTRMRMSAFKQLWPIIANPPVRRWVLDHIRGGVVERTAVAINTPLSTFGEHGAPILPEGLSIDVTASSVALQPILALPAIRDSDLTMSVAGHSTKLVVARGTVVLPSGRKLAVSNGLFEVPNSYPPNPPTRTQFRLDGPVQAATEVLSLESLSGVASAPFDPAQTRGTVSAQVDLDIPLDPELPPDTVKYKVAVDISNFIADKMVLGQKVEAASLKALATNDGYEIKGDVKIAGMPAALDYRKASGAADAELRLDATLDDGARNRLGLNFGPGLTGPVPIKVTGNIADGNNRLKIEADFTQAKIDDLLPGWNKPPGRPARARFAVITGAQGTRLDDLAIEGSGIGVKGVVELDAASELISASFPVFGLSDGDRASLKAERGSDGVLKVTIRGELYDGRGFLKAAMAGGTPDDKNKSRADNLDLDVKLSAVAGFHGEALRQLELKMSRRAGRIRSLNVNGRLGVDAPLIADLRGRTGGRQVVYLETSDAGAFFRLTDVYPKIEGGQMWVALDPPTPDRAPQEGILNIRDFSVRGEAALDRVVSTSPGGANSGVEFTRLRVEFTRQPGRLVIRDGVVRGPVIGATIDGTLDYARNDVRMRGTFVPLYGLNNVFGQLPIVGLFLGGGSNEGLVGITYEVVGQPGAPVLRVNPISAVAPGLLRKFFEFPGHRQDGPAVQSYTDQPR